MFKTFTIAICFLSFSTLTLAAENAHSICTIKGTPNADQYKVIKRVIAAKGTYGSIEEVYPRFIDRVQQTGGDVVINYRASQRFGFWPWRVVRPVIYGTAVKWNTPVDCKSIGGIEI